MKYIAQSRGNQLDNKQSFSHDARNFLMNMFRYEFACNVFDAKTSPTNVETSMITACSNAKTELEYYNKEQQLAHFPTNNVACYVNLLGGIN